MKKERKNNGSDFRKIETDSAVNREFPVKIYSEYRIFFSEDSYHEMKEHANQTSEVELGGVLIGDVCIDNMGAYLNICGIISGEHSNNYGAQVTFTHETWQHINDVKDRKYPDKRIVGWYHTHPGFGVFLSEMDMFIQDNFFNLPYQVAVVLETKEAVEGCFVWKDGKSTPLQRYWVGDREIELVTGKVNDFKLPSEHIEDEVKKTVVNDYGSSWSVQFMVVIIMIMLFLIGLMWGKASMLKELKMNVYEMVQSEFYSILEYASLNTSASQDLSLIQAKLNKIKKDAADGKTDISKDFKNLNSLIDNLKVTYDKHRTRFRQDLRELEQKKNNLSQRVQKNIYANEELKRELAMLSLLRIKDVLIKVGGKYELLPPEDKMFVRMLLIMVLHNDPAMKTVIENSFPGLIRQIVPAGSDLPESNGLGYGRDNYNMMR